MTLNYFRTIFFVGSLLFCQSYAWSKSSRLDDYHAEIQNFSIDENINSLEIPKKYIDAALAAMGVLSGQLEKDGFKTDLSEGDGLILMVTIPVSELFAPNDTILRENADNILDKFKNHLKVPDKYRLLVVVHSDDTGTEEYLYHLTKTRADAIVSWFESKGIPTEGIVPYGLGYDEPLITESTRKSRAENRRVEFYFIPGPVMIEDLKIKRRK